jgi:hypothetical protein
MLTVLGGFAMIAVLLAAHALALYAIWWVVMAAVSRFPIVGRRHRHRDWERLNDQRSQSSRTR